MPEMSGLDAIKAILNLDPNAKIIMCTAVDHKELADEAIACGAKAYIIKPFSEEKVLKIVKKVLGE